MKTKAENLSYYISTSLVIVCVIICGLSLVLFGGVLIEFQRTSGDIDVFSFLFLSSYSPLVDSMILFFTLALFIFITDVLVFYAYSDMKEEIDKLLVENMSLTEEKEELMQEINQFLMTKESANENDVSGQTELDFIFSESKFGENVT